MRAGGSRSASTLPRSDTNKTSGADRVSDDDFYVRFRGEPLSSSIVVPARRPRLRRIAFTGALLVAASVAVVAYGQAGSTSFALAASVRPVPASAPALSDRQLLAESGPLRAVVRAQQDAQAAAEAQAAAAAAAAAQAAAAQAAARARTARAVPSTSRGVNVWTAGWQAEINACRGGVDITSHYAVPTVAQHWGCGGSSFPTAAGSVVQFTGLDAGTYRILGVVAVLDAYTAKTSQLPRGYDLLFQTCRNNNSHTTEFVALQKIG